MRSFISSFESLACRCGRLPCGLVVGVLLFAGAESAVWKWPRLLRVLEAYSDGGTDADPVRTHARIVLAPRHPARESIFFLGSSQVREGVDDSVLAEEFPGRYCANLGISAAGPSDADFLARRVRRHTRQAVLVIGVNPITIQAWPKSDFCDLPSVARALSCGAMERADRSQWQVLGSGLILSSSQTLRSKDGLARAWGQVKKRGLGAAWNLAAPPVAKYRREEEPVDQADGPQAGEVKLKPWLLTLSRRAIGDIVRRERDAGRPVFLVEFPVKSGCLERYEPAVIASYENLVGEFAGMPGVTFLRIRDIVEIGDADFLDMTHLNERGRRKATAALAGRIAQPTGEATACPQPPSSPRR